MSNPVVAKTFKLLSDFSLVTTATEAREWHDPGDKHGYGRYTNPDETLIATNETGAHYETAESILDSSRTLLISPAAQRALKAHLRHVEEERDRHYANLAAIARAKEILGLD